MESQKRPDTVAQFILDEINSTKSLEFADLFLVFNDAFELGNSIRPFSKRFFKSSNDGLINRFRQITTVTGKLTLLSLDPLTARGI